MTPKKCAAFFILCLSLNSSLQANAFGNNAVSIPKVGTTFFDTSLIRQQKPWGLGPQWLVGTSFRKAFNYRWWWLAETDFAMGSLTKDKSAYLSTFLGGAGIRFNFLDGNVRPYSSLMFHYLHFLGSNVKKLPLDVDWPIWVGLKPAFGVEWLFYSEMALCLEGAYGFYINLKEPYRHVLFLNAAFAFYF